MDYVLTISIEDWEEPEYDYAYQSLPENPECELNFED